MLHKPVMQNVRRLLQWPKTEDKFWLEKSEMVCNVSEPLPTGKSVWMFKLTESDINKIESKDYRSILTSE